MPIIKLLGKTMKALHIIQTKFKNDPIVVRLGYSRYVHKQMLWENI